MTRASLADTEVLRYTRPVPPPPALYVVPGRRPSPRPRLDTPLEDLLPVATPVDVEPRRPLLYGGRRRMPATPLRVRIGYALIGDAR